MQNELTARARGTCGARLPQLTPVDARLPPLTDTRENAKRSHGGLGNVASSLHLNPSTSRCAGTRGVPGEGDFRKCETNPPNHLARPYLDPRMPLIYADAHLMKFAFSTVSCPTWDFDTIVSRAKDYGHDGVEV